LQKPFNGLNNRKTKEWKNDPNRDGHAERLRELSDDLPSKGWSQHAGIFLQAEMETCQPVGSIPAADLVPDA
jgi:hypothetical protein